MRLKPPVLVPARTRCPSCRTLSLRWKRAPACTGSWLTARLIECSACPWTGTPRDVYAAKATAA